jgi:hypothetical protein
MESRLTESCCETLPRDLKTPEDAHSLPGHKATMSLPLDSSGSCRNIIRYLSTAATTALSRSLSFDITSGRYGSAIASAGFQRRALPFLACFVGVVAWSGHVLTIPLALLLLVLLSTAMTRRGALTTSVAYYAGATWQILPGAATFFGHHANPVEVLSLWAGASLLLAAPWAILWSSRQASRLWRMPLALVLLAIPPFGVIGCASPLVAAGLLFPGTAWFGLALTAIVCGLLSSYPALGLALALVFATPAHLFYRSQPAPPGWRAESTRFGGVGLDTPTPLADYQAAHSIQQIAVRSDARVILFPETVVTNWNPGTDLFWKPTIDTLREQGKTMLVGANVFDPASRHYFNSIVIRGAEQHSDFVQRVPIPVAMWIPLSKTGVPLQLGKPGTAMIAGQKAALLICYEQLLVWPVVTSFMQHPTLLLGTANDYWAKNTTIPEIQRACLESWARLFRVPLLWAQNT